MRERPWVRKVLVVEDDRDLREVLLQVLRAEGLDAEDVGDADRACARLVHEPNRALLFDPGRPGAALPAVDRLMHRAGTFQKSVLVVSGCKRVARRASELGVSFVPAPFELGDLIGALQRLG